MGAVVAIAAVAGQPPCSPAQLRTFESQVIQFDEQERQLVVWMKCARAGNRSASDNLVRASIPLIKRVAARQGVPADCIDDVVQETLLTIHLNRESYDANRP